MEDIAAAACMAIFAAVFSAVIKSRNREMSLLLVISASAAVMLASLSKVLPVVSQIEKYVSSSNIDMEYFKIMLKAAGVTIAAAAAKSICRDAGENSLCGAVSIAEKVAVLLIALPVISKIFDFMSQLLNF